MKLWKYQILLDEMNKEIVNDFEWQFLKLIFSPNIKYHESTQNDYN